MKKLEREIETMTYLYRHKKGRSLKSIGCLQKSLVAECPTLDSKSSKYFMPFLNERSPQGKLLRKRHQSLESVQSTQASFSPPQKLVVRTNGFDYIKKVQLREKRQLNKKAVEMGKCATEQEQGQKAEGKLKKRRLNPFEMSYLCIRRLNNERRMGWGLMGYIRLLEGVRQLQSKLLRGVSKERRRRRFWESRGRRLWLSQVLLLDTKATLYEVMV